MSTVGMTRTGAMTGTETRTRTRAEIEAEIRARIRGRHSAEHPLPTNQRQSGRHRIVIDTRTVPEVPPPPDLSAVVLPPVISLPRRVFTHPRLMHYNRLIALVAVANVVTLGYGWFAGRWWSQDETALAACSWAALANLALAILIRQQYVINVLFWLATRAPTRWPLRIRRTLAKVYHFGGLHVGGAIAGTVWFGLLTATVVQAVLAGSTVMSTPLVVISSALALLLVVIVVTALPPVRARKHDRFERTHRFGGWSALALFWLLTVLGITSRPGAHSPGIGTVLASPQVWVLTALTVSIVLPWLRLRKVPVQIDRPSSHVAVATLQRTKKPFPGSSTSISLSPLRDWHAFANIPQPGERNFRLAVSRAGDWTGSFIDQPPRAVWVKGITTAGVANVERLFRKVVYVASGSGVGPVLPHLLAGDVPSHLVWSTRSPRVTYGDALVGEILRIRPDARIWDTKLYGKPDMLRLAYLAYVESGAEAVICISNKSMTWQVVHGLERCGIPAYGAIWDS
jgi:hypothetical protein